MSERAAMKRRVRGLLHKNWLAPLGAVSLALLPVVALYAGLFFLMRPAPVEGAEILFTELFTIDNPNALVTFLLIMLSRPLELLQPYFGWIPFIAVTLVIHLFVFLPMLVALAGYFLSFLRGKKPKPTDVLGSFSGKYPRVFGSMAYLLLWQIIWFTVSFLIPIAVMLGAVQIISGLGLTTNTQLYLFVGTLIVCTLWLIIFLFVYLNRMLAYCLTPVCIAAQPRLHAHRGVRLSRKLMRGCKWRVIGLFFSFIPYFLPTILAGLCLLLLPTLGPSLALSAVTMQTLRIILWIVIGANQLAWLFVAPYMSACYHAFYIERKREALMDEELKPEDFASRPREDGKPIPIDENTEH